MKSHSAIRLTGSLMAGLVLISAGAHAATGYTVSTDREGAIAPGMSTSDVQQLLGPPARVARYGNAPGPIWTYRVLAPLFGRTEFNVEFGADERVQNSGEIVIGNEAPNGGRD